MDKAVSKKTVLRALFGYGLAVFRVKNRVEYPQGGVNTPQNPRENMGSPKEATQIPTQSQQVGADLRAVVQVWTSLPDRVRAAIIALIREGRDARS
jgi:hypothetical protein